jgi:hypothetical protein
MRNFISSCWTLALFWITPDLLESIFLALRDLDELDGHIFGLIATVHNWFGPFKA